MKKYIITIMMFLIMFFIMGCSAYDPMTDDLSIYDSLTFDFESLSYTNTSPYDILYQTGKPDLDLLILVNRNDPNLMRLEDQVKYQALLETLFNLSKLSNETMKYILTLSSMDLRTLYETYDFNIGLSDIVLFNNLKMIMKDLELKEDIVLYITKIDYLNLRLDITLSQEEIGALETLQQYHLRFSMDDYRVVMREETFDTWLDKLSLLGELPGETLHPSLEKAFDQIKSLY